MKEFDIEFEVRSLSIYSASVEAETPQEALQLFIEDPGSYEAEEDTMLEYTNDLDTLKCIGERVEDHIGSHLESFDKPVKL